MNISTKIKQISHEAKAHRNEPTLAFGHREVLHGPQIAVGRKPDEHSPGEDRQNEHVEDAQDRQYPLVEKLVMITSTLLSRTMVNVGVETSTDNLLICMPK